MASLYKSLIGLASVERILSMLSLRSSLEMIGSIFGLIFMISPVPDVAEALMGRLVNKTVAYRCQGDFLQTRMPQRVNVTSSQLLPSVYNINISLLPD